MQAAIFTCAAVPADRLVRACAELPKLCEFFHIPFQSGDNDILREVRGAFLVLGMILRDEIGVGGVVTDSGDECFRRSLSSMLLLGNNGKLA